MKICFTFSKGEVTFSTIFPLSSINDTIDVFGSEDCRIVINDVSRSLGFTLRILLLRWNRDVCVDNDHLVLNDFPHTLQLNVKYVISECFDSLCRLRAATDVNLRKHVEHIVSVGGLLLANKCSDLKPPENVAKIKNVCVTIKIEFSLI